MKKFDQVRMLVLVCSLVLLIPLQASYGEWVSSMTNLMRDHATWDYDDFQYEYAEYVEPQGIIFVIQKKFLIDDDTFIPHINDIDRTKVRPWVGIVDSWYERELISEREYQYCLKYLVEKVF